MQQPQRIPNIVDVYSLPQSQSAVTQSECRLKYIDNQIQAEIIDRKAALQLSESSNGPRDYHDRHSKLQCHLDAI